MSAPVPSPFVPERTQPVALTGLAARFGLVGEPGAGSITGISLGSGAVRPGDLFIALQGVRGHGIAHAAQAVSLGAVAVLTDPEAAGRVDVAVPVLTTPEPRLLLGDLAAAVYRTRDQHPLLFGITGTNGKTSTSHLLAGLLELLSVRAGLSSTAERQVGAERRVAGLTTPEATELHALIARMHEAGVEAAAIEVSAQGLSRHRLDGVRFDVAGFTNLSHDHLDDYADMEEYYAAKAVLFQPDRAARAVVSLDTPWGDRVAHDAGVPIVTVVQNGRAPADWTVRVTEETQAHTAFELAGPAGTISTRIPVLGAHMAANAGLAIVMLLEAGYAFDRLKTLLEAPAGMAVSLPGRTELVSGPGAPAVYVDFGHSPHAFQETLAAVRAVTPGRVIMLFGADGDRDTTKRADMSRAAVEGSDVLVVTDHHPRFEDPASIRQSLLAAAREAAPDHPLHEEGQPEKAIRLAVSLARPGDAILWAGPGHQNYRDIRGVRTDYSARREARAALREAGYAAAESHDLAT